MASETVASTSPQHKLDPFPPLLAPQASAGRQEYLYVYWLVLGYGHAAAAYGLYLACTAATWETLLFQSILNVLGTLGITAGLHRLWSHRAYKATMPLQIILMILSSLGYQNTAMYWVRDHRMHHRYSDTDADPHNATRGFFYSHIGWLLLKKHPEVKRRGKVIDMSDLYANPVLCFQKKYAVPLMGSICFVLPTLIPMYFFGETLNVAWNLNILRYVFNLNTTFSVNSFAHFWGNKPYDKHFKAVQNTSVSFLTLGEGFHNYHHAFPWDYRTAELGNNWLNPTTKFIDLCARLGWAYDLKTVPADAARARAARTGDGSDMWGRRQDSGQ